MSARRPVRSGAALLATVVVAAFSPAGAQAAPGDLDLTFSGDGKQTTNLGVGFSPARAIARQPDGKLVAVGTSFGHDNGDFAVARYNPDGSLDPSFSDDGKLTTSGFGFGAASTERASGVAIQGDGKIVVVGTGGVSGDFALARYNLDGSLDPSFSGDGKQATDIGGGGDAATGVAIQGDGKIVVVGSAVDDDRDFALARYNLDGSLDASFSGDGKLTTDFFGHGDGANGVALQSDGKIVALGHAGGVNFALARYNPNGSLDATFSDDGKQITDFGGFERANGVALQDDGTIVAVGRSRFDFALARYSPNGSLDASFSGDGKQTTDFGGPAGSFAAANGVALQGDGKIVVVGHFRSNGADFAVARYNTNGSLDPSFSGDGRQTSDFGGGDKANGVAVQADGKIVAVGRGGALDFALARYNPDGSLDSSFSGDGRQTTEFGGADSAWGMALQTDGKIVAVGLSPRSDTTDFALTRYDAGGELDPSFSGDGRQTTDFGGREAARGVALQGDGKIVVLGEIGPSNGFALARYNANGSLDPSFSGDGKQTTGFGGFDRATGVAIQGDGKILVVGTGGFDTSGYSEFALARYDANGELDTSFSGDGKQTTDFFGRGDSAHGVVLQDDGKIVAVGVTERPLETTDFALARYDTDGSLDTSFSGDGRQTTDFGPDDGATGVALQADGKVVAVGSGGDIFAPASTDFAVARYDTDGSLDTSFSGDGRQTTDFAGGPDVANGVAIQGDGKIVAVGGLRFSPSSLTGDFALARYDTDGSIDTSFSGEGRQTTDFGPYDTANGVAIQGDGRIVAAGFGAGPSQSLDFALARYMGG